MATNGRQTTRNTLTAAEIKKRSTKKLAERAIELINPNDLLSASQEKLCLALSYLDITQLSQAKATELISVIKQLFDITQVLQGKPTSINASANRKALEDLLPRMIREAERRGMQVASQGKVIEGEVLSAKPLRAKSTRHTPPGHSVSGPIAASERSDFSKVIDSL